MCSLDVTTIMSIPKLDSSSALSRGVEELPDDPHDTGLITRLVNEIYAESPGEPSSTSGTPSGSLGDFGGQGFGNRGAGGGAPPPVHPIIEAPLTEHPRRDEVRSGGHTRDSRDAHAFGEPRCETGRIQGLRGEQLDPYPGPRENGASAPAAPSPDPSALYFLQSGESGAPLAGLKDSFPGSPGYGDASRRFSYPTTGAPLAAGFDVERIRRDFPALHQKVHGRDLIWFDNAATTQKPHSVIDGVSQFYERDNSNVNRAAHELAARATELYEGAREKVREFIGAADAKEIIFLRGTTEAINLVAQTFGKQNIGAGDEILLTTMEHHANIVPWKILSEQVGATLRVAPINDRGELLLDQFAALLSERTKIVAVTHVSNALGTVNPVEQIIAIAHAYGVPVLVDGAQSTPHLPVNVQAMNADFFTFSGHKIFGPTGIGVLYGKAELLERMPAYQGGGSMIEDVTFSKIVYKGIPQKFEAGTQDIAGVVGLGAAIDYLQGIGLPAIAAYEHELLDYATEGLRSLRGIRQIGTAANKAGVLSFVVPGHDSEKIGAWLDEYGIAVRAGHHCAQPSLRRFGVETAVRPSFAFYNTRREIDFLIQTLHQLPKR
jgi:cysteine desulfurase / selenocysteine lyase